ncbi:Histone H1-like nucleoprotein HC2 [Gimesia alba]|uniref:Histone H1-like nucleoprotein HC2 n=1 Tax=Gimesia alba TaxID=2527973 RepID=A0A517RB20_9PLAN|nr:hypothetical protein [Gimesia alba]QDT41068.1 Histone H1-like nucleoprotein HC2 [Gimesia alba]
MNQKNQGGSMKEAAKQAGAKKPEGQQDKAAAEKAAAEKAAADKAAAEKAAAEKAAAEKAAAEKAAADKAAAEKAAAEKAAADKAAAEAQEALLQKLKEAEGKLDQLEKENAALKDAAVDSATEIGELRKMNLTPTSDDTGLYQASLKSNPTRFVKANNPGEAQRIYFDFFGVTASENGFSCSPVDAAPEGEQVIYVDEAGKVCSKTPDGALLVAGG